MSLNSSAPPETFSCDDETLIWQRTVYLRCCHGNHSSAAPWTIEAKNKILLYVYWFGIFLVSLSSLKPDKELCFDL